MNIHTQILNIFSYEILIEIISFLSDFLKTVIPLRLIVIFINSGVYIKSVFFLYIPNRFTQDMHIYKNHI